MPNQTPILNAAFYIALVAVFFTICHLLCGCAVQGPAPAVVGQCVAATVEAGGDVTLCAAGTGNNPIVVTCVEQGAPTPELVGNARCEPGREANTWCCDATPIPSACQTHTHAELLHGATCEAGAPDCAFDDAGALTPLAPTGLVQEVCHCIGGVYACFGRQP